MLLKLLELGFFFKCDAILDILFFSNLQGKCNIYVKSKYIKINFFKIIKKMSVQFRNLF